VAGQGASGAVRDSGGHRCLGHAVGIARRYLFPMRHGGFGILGPLEVRDHRGRAVPLGGQKPRELLALFLLNHGQTVSVDRLVAHLWGESPSHGAAITLRTHIGRVRKVIHDADTQAALVNHLRGYRLEIDAPSLDSEKFEALVSDGQRAITEHRLTQAVALLGEGLNLWRGEVLEDLGPPDFATTAATRLNELRLVAWEHQMDSQLATGQHAEAISRLQQLVEEHPFRERYTAQLMLALYRSGRQAEALATFASARRRLAEELGLDPGPDLRQLETSMLRQEPSLEQSAPVPVTLGADRMGSGPGGELVDAPSGRIMSSDLSRQAPGHPDLLERASVLELLSGAYTDASASGRFIWLTGEAGVGKTSVLRAFARELDAPVWSGYCDPLTTPRPLGPLLDLAEGPIPELHQTLAAGAKPFATFGLLLKAMQRQPVPPVLVLEDVHWADDATLDLMRFLTRRLSGTSGLIIASLRDHESGVPPELVRLVGDSLRETGIERVSLSPLSRDAVKRLSSGRGVDADRLFEVSGGNPFFVTEVLAAGSLFPSNVLSAVHARAARLGDESRAVLDVVSLDPRAVEVEHVRRIADVTEEAIDATVSSGFLEEHDRRLSFRHELARRAIADNLGSVRRRRLHARLLERLLGTGGSDDPARMAHHADAAGDAEAARTHALKAAERAVALGSHREALEQYERVLRYTPESTDASYAELLGRLSYEFHMTGRIDDALGVQERALAVWEGVGDLARIGDAQRWLSRLSWFLGQNAEAEEYAARACDTLEGRGDALEAMALCNRGQLRMLAADVAGTRAWTLRTLAILDRLPSSPEVESVRVHAMINLGSVEADCGDPERGFELLDDSLRRSREADFHEHAARAYTNIVALAVMQHDHQRADAVLPEALDYYAQRDLDAWNLEMRGDQAVSLLERGELAEALRCAEAVLRHPLTPPVSRIQPLTVIACAHARLGHDGWSEPLAEATALAESRGEAQRGSYAAAAACEIAWLDGDQKTWQAAAVRGWSLVSQSASPWNRGRVASWLPALDSEEVEGLPPPYRAEAEGRWEDAAAIWSELGSRYAEGLAWARSGTLDGLARAVTCFEEQGAVRAAERARSLLRVQSRTKPLGPTPNP
jgi:DNA-binding SARP family transcriptional activator